MLNPVQQAYDLIEAYDRAIALLAKAKAEVESVPEHVAENECDGGHPLDDIADGIAHLTDRKDALRGWLALNEKEAA